MPPLAKELSIAAVADPKNDALVGSGEEGPPPSVVVIRRRRGTTQDLSLLERGRDAEEADSQVEEDDEEEALPLYLPPGMDAEQLRQMVPHDDCGMPLLAGTAGHLQMLCKPCRFAAMPFGCTKGVSCGFCHYEHDLRRRPPRSCRGSRMRKRLRNLVGRLEHEIELDPSALDHVVEALPASVVKSEVTKTKLVARLQQHAAEVRGAIEEAAEKPALDDHTTTRAIAATEELNLNQNYPDYESKSNSCRIVYCSAAGVAKPLTPWPPERFFSAPYFRFSV